MPANYRDLPVKVPEETARWLEREGWARGRPAHHVAAEIVEREHRRAVDNGQAQGQASREGSAGGYVQGPDEWVRWEGTGKRGWPKVEITVQPQSARDVARNEVRITMEVKG